MQQVNKKQKEDLECASNKMRKDIFEESSKTDDIKYVVSDNGTVYYNPISDEFEAGVKVVGYLNKDCTIKSGKGTIDNPYVITK